MKKKITNHTNILYGISFLCIEIPYYDFVIYDLCD